MFSLFKEKKLCAVVDKIDWNLSIKSRREQKLWKLSKIDYFLLINLLAKLLTPNSNKIFSFSTLLKLINNSNKSAESFHDPTSHPLILPSYSNIYFYRVQFLSTVSSLSHSFAMAVRWKCIFRVDGERRIPLDNPHAIRRLWICVNEKNGNWILNAVFVMDLELKLKKLLEGNFKGLTFRSFKFWRFFWFLTRLMYSEF